MSSGTKAIIETQPIWCSIIYTCYTKYSCHQYSNVIKETNNVELNDDFFRMSQGLNEWTNYANIKACRNLGQPNGDRGTLGGPVYIRWSVKARALYTMQCPWLRICRYICQIRIIVLLIRISKYSFWISHDHVTQHKRHNITHWGLMNVYREYYYYHSLKWDWIFHPSVRL